MKKPLNIQIQQDELIQLCQHNHIQRLAVFGSVLREDFRAGSDVDVLVEFEPDAHIGWEFVAIQDALTSLLGREVDLHTPQSLSRHFRDKILYQAEVIYERAG